LDPTLNSAGLSDSPPGSSPNDLQALALRVSASLQKVESHVSRLEKVYNTLSFAGIFSSATTTLLTAWTSAAGPIWGNDVSAWRLTCIVAAVLGFLTTLFMGVNQQFQARERLSRANECLGRLKSLDFALLTRNQNLQEAWKDFADILRKYPEELR
jgi:hypothetical protein